MKHDHMIREKITQAQAQEQVKKQMEAARVAFLGRLAGASGSMLDHLCNNDQDKVEVLSTLSAHIAARAGATEDEFLAMTKRAWLHQSAEVAKARAEGKLPPAPVVERAPTAEPVNTDGQREGACPPSEPATT